MIIIQTTIDEDKKAKDLINLLLETNKIANTPINIDWINKIIVNPIVPKRKNWKNNQKNIP